MSIDCACPYCRGAFQFPAEYTGKAISCPDCDKPIRIIAVSTLGAIRSRPSSPRVLPWTASQKAMSVVIAALCSILLVWVSGVLANGPRLPDSDIPEAYEKWEQDKEARDVLDSRLEPLGTDSSAVYTALFFGSLILSLSLVFASGCLWSKHSPPGRVLTITAGILLALCICFGLS